MTLNGERLFIPRGWDRFRFRGVLYRQVQPAPGRMWSIAPVKP